MKDNGLAIIYQKTAIKDENDNEIYAYTPIAVESGRFENNQFINNKDERYSFINQNIEDEEYVYAFPYFTQSKNEEIDELFEKIENIYNQFDDYILYQVYDPNNNPILIASNDELESNKQVDPSSFGQYLTMIEYETSEHEFKNDIEINNIQIIKKDISISANKAFDFINKSIIAQDNQIKQIATILAKNLHLANIFLNTDSKDKESLIRLKQNLLLCGPSNVGKTETIKLISKYIGLPIVVADSAKYKSLYLEDYTKAIVADLLISANYDIYMAKRGIVLFEEFDQKFPTYSPHTQSLLLNIMRGEIVPFESENSNDNYDFDTSTLTFVFTGNFSSIERCEKKVGFESPIIQREIYTYDNFINFGINKEFLNSVNCIKFNEINKEILKRILLESNLSPLVLNQKLYESLGIKLICPNDSADLIAEKAQEYNLGAKGIERVIDKLLRKIEYDIYSNSNYPSEIIITPESIEDNQRLIIKK